MKYIACCGEKTNCVASMSQKKLIGTEVDQIYEIWFLGGSSTCPIYIYIYIHTHTHTHTHSYIGHVPLLAKF